MMSSAMKRVGLAVAVLGLAVGVSGRVEAGVTLDFEHLSYNASPISGPHSAFTIDGFQLTATAAGTNPFYSIGPSYPSYYVGSNAVYSTRLTVPFATLAMGGQAFTLNSIDLSEFHRTQSPPGTLASFTGYRSDGSSVSQTFALDGVFGLETFTFTDFTNLSYVRFAQNSIHQMDNIRLNYEVAAAVPEPSTLAGGLLGVALMGGAWLRRRKRQAA